jgi:hypothetical protein
MVAPRLAALASLACVTSLLAACGGKTPPANTEDTAASGAKGDDSTASSAAPAASDAPAATTAAPAPAPAPAADTGDIKPTGGDDPWMAGHQVAAKDVSKTMRAAQGKVQACFKKDPSATGDVKIRFVVTNDGAVRVWKDDGSSMSDGDVTQCIGELLNKLKFPKQKSPGDAWGVYSVHFGVN